MIRKFTFGNPFPTDAVVLDIPASGRSEFPAEISLSDDNTVLQIRLGADDVIYGLGESMHGMNKRGFQYISNNTDEPHHNEDKYSLYGAHNFLLIDTLYGKTGLFIDYPATVTYDIGFTDKDLLEIAVEEADYDLYLITGDSDLSIIQEFRSLIGQSYLAPKWAFGYGQSRWGYRSAEDIRSVVEGYRKNDIPLDSVYMDIDYMVRYEDFTINEEAFPDFADFVAEMKEQHIHLVPIIDAGIKVENGYSVYEEGVRENYFCKDENGNDFITAVWPGRAVLPDFLNPEVRRWFGRHYDFLIQQGIDGFWNDMNEPALFYSEKHLHEVMDQLKEYQEKVDSLTLDELWGFQGMVQGMANNPEDYRSFYHNVNGQKIRHDRVHNLYGFNMTRAAAEAFSELAPEKDILMFSRSSYIGMHRYAGIWTGDNCSFWSHLDLLVHQLPNLNMCGFLFVGADTGGFGHNTSEELMMRFVALSMFTPLMRNHSAIGTREQELYRFKDIESFRNLINLRYALIPYLYEAYCKAITDNTLMFTPLSMAYPEDAQSRHIEDQLLVGSSIMIAPVTKPNADGRYVYLPETMKLLRFRSVDDYDEEILSAGYHYVKAAVNEVLIFVLPDHFLYLGRPAQSTAQLEAAEFTYFTL